MGISDIGRSNHSWQLTRAFKYDTIIKHFNLNLCTLYIIGSMATSIHYHLLDNKFGVISACYKLA